MLHCTQKPQVRFKLASSYSGRVLKHVYEDGQELESPEEKYPHSFVHRKIPPSHLEVEQLCGFQEPHGDQPGGLISLCYTVLLFSYLCMTALRFICVGCKPVTMEMCTLHLCVVLPAILWGIVHEIVLAYFSFYNNLMAVYD